MKKSTPIRDIPKILRPREKLRNKGVGNLKDAELLAIILGTGYQGKNVLQLAQSILNKHRGRKFLSLIYDDLIKIKGISQAKACSILAANELAKRKLGVREEILPRIKSANDIVAQAIYLRDKLREHLMVIFLNARGEMIYKKPMFVGSLNANIAHPREIFAEALKQNAAAVALIHNHPSGDVQPSQEDIETTKRIAAAGELMGIELVDHVIMAKTKFFSFREKKLI